MSARGYSVVCYFDQKIPRITAYEIHEWLHDMLHLHEGYIRMIQIDGPRRKVYIHFINNEGMVAVLKPMRTT
jgi:hypothetical protein